MKIERRNFLRLAAGAAALSSAPHIAQAQGYPTRTVTLTTSGAVRLAQLQASIFTPRCTL